MSTRRRKGETILEPGRLLDAMGECRRAVIHAQTDVRPFGETYLACNPVIEAIDALACYLTGSDTYYHLKPHSNTGAAKAPTASPDDTPR